MQNACRQVHVHLYQFHVCNHIALPLLIAFLWFHKDLASGFWTRRIYWSKKLRINTRLKLHWEAELKRKNAAKMILKMIKHRFYGSAQHRCRPLLWVSRWSSLTKSRHCCDRLIMVMSNWQWLLWAIDNWSLLVTVICPACWPHDTTVSIEEREKSCSYPLVITQLDIGISPFANDLVFLKIQKQNPSASHVASSV